MQRLIQNDWFWVGGSTLIATVSAVFVFWIRVGNQFAEETTPAIISVALGTACSAGLFSWRLIMHTVADNKLTYGMINGFWGALGAHLLSGIFMLTILPIIAQNGIEIWGFLVGIFLVTFFGIASAYGVTLIYGAFLGVLLGWLYTRTHPAPENQKANLSD